MAGDGPFVRQCGQKSLPGSPLRQGGGRENRISSALRTRTKNTRWSFGERSIMSIVRFALRFPHCFYILAGMMLFLGCSAIVVMPKDIVPAIDIPVVIVIWQYSSLSPQEMEQRITTYSEYPISANVGNIRNTESQTYEGPPQVWGCEGQSGIFASVV